MTSSTNTSIKRRIASVMLVFWLFALGAGWANACVLQERATHLHPENAIALAGTPTVSAGHVGVLDDHEADSSPGKAPCLKVCGDKSQSIVKWHASFDLLDVAMVPPTAMPWPATGAAHDAPRTVHVGQPPRGDLPLRIRYSRLAL